MTYLLMGIVTVLVVAADQITKYLVVQGIPLYGTVPAIDGLFHLTYTQNTGAAWSLFEGQQWLFALVFLVFAAGIVWEFSKKRLPLVMCERWAIIAVFAGGLGNMIDRIRLGYVVDMIAVDFINFPVFNVADCFITCGSIFLLFHLIFFNKPFWKDEKK